jgi:hypothetical protein
MRVFMRYDLPYLISRRMSYSSAIGFKWTMR